MVSSTGQNLVFILSPPRSGSTLLGAMLGSHPSVACPAEPWFLLRLAGVYGAATSLDWHDDGLAALATRAFLDADTFRRAAREFAATAYNAHLARTGRRLFVDKTPRYYHILDFLAGTFPQAKHIWLQRNPFAVAASFKITWNVETDILTGRCLTPHSFDLALALRCLARHFERPSPLHLEVQYEELVRQPEVELRRVCDFLELPFEASMLRYGENGALMDAYRRSEFGDRSLLDHTSIHTDAVDRWRQVLSPAEVVDVAQIIEPELLTRMGYAAPALDPAAAPPAGAAGPAVAVLTRSRSPAEPSEVVRDPETDLVLHALENSDSARELAQTLRDRDRWRASYAELEKNRDDYRTAYETIVADRDRWQAAHNTVEIDRNYNRDAYETIVADRDRWQAAHNLMEANRNHYRDAYQAMTGDRDRWQAAHADMDKERDRLRQQCQQLAESMEASRDDARRAIEELTVERDHWQAAFRRAEELLHRVPLRLTVATMRWLGWLARGGGRQT
jgi:hypothetical protein